MVNLDVVLLTVDCCLDLDCGCNVSRACIHLEDTALVAVAYIDIVLSIKDEIHKVDAL